MPFLPGHPSTGRPRGRNLVPCDQCGATFHREPRKVGDRNFCSIPCAALARSYAPSRTIVLVNGRPSTMIASPQVIRLDRKMREVAMAEGKIRAERAARWEGLIAGRMEEVEEARLRVFLGLRGGNGMTNPPPTPLVIRQAPRPPGPKPEKLRPHIWLAGIYRPPEVIRPMAILASTERRASRLLEVLLRSHTRQEVSTILGIPATILGLWLKGLTSPSPLHLDHLYLWAIHEEALTTEPYHADAGPLPLPCPPLSGGGDLHGWEQPSVCLHATPQRLPDPAQAQDPAGGYRQGRGPQAAGLWTPLRGELDQAPGQALSQR